MEVSLEGRVMEAREVQAQKMAAPKPVRLSGRVTETRESHQLKA